METELTNASEIVTAGEPSEANEANVVSHEDVKIGNVTAENVSLEDSAVGSIKGNNVTATMANGVIGAVVASRADVKVTNGALGAVVAQAVTITDSNVNIIIAGQVTGNARIMFDMRAGLLAGLVTGLMLVAFRLLQGSRAR